MNDIIGAPKTETGARQAKNQKHGALAVNAEDAIPIIKAIIVRERKNGCPMASEDLIEPALRHWRSYERRFKRHKDKSLAHRAHDLEKGLRGYCAPYYDSGCIRHLAQSFAEVLMQGSADNLATSAHKVGSPAQCLKNKRRGNLKLTSCYNQQFDD